MKKTKKNKVSPDFEHDVSELLESCETISGYKREVGEGALFNANKQKMTKKEFKETIDKFLKKEVK